MKASEFYEKYWRVQNAVGEWVRPCPLTDAQKKYLDTCAEYPDCVGVMMFGKRRRPVCIDVEHLKQQMSKMPTYFIPDNQPLLDKFGSSIETNQNEPS